MARRGYVIFAVRANRRSHRDEGYRLDDLNGAGDLLAGFHAALQGMSERGTPHKDERYERAFDVLDVSRRGRLVWLQADAGPYGQNGNTTNIDTGARRGFNHRDANMIPKRAMLAIPTGSEVGFLFCERVSGSTLKDHLVATAFRACKQHYRISLTVDPVTDLEAWDRYLRDARGVEVRSVWQPTTLERRLNPGTGDVEGELKMVLTGSFAERAALGIISGLRRRANRDNNAVVEILETPLLLRPASADGVERRRMEVVIEDGATRRTVVIEKDELPAFVYDLGDAPPDQTLRDTWIAEAERLSVVYGVDVPAGWHTGDWVADARDVGIVVPQ